MRLDHPIGNGIGAVAVAAALAACGGGGSSSPAATDQHPLTLSGVAASGAALSGAVVTANCAIGSGGTPTDPAGSYKLALADAALPCVLKVVSSDGATVLHSVATGSADAAAATAHITPLTELVVAHLGGVAPDAFFDSATPASLASTVTSAAVQSAETAVANALSASIPSIGTIGDFVSAPLVPASGTTSGNAYDAALDALAATLTGSGASLASLATTVAAMSPAASASAGAEAGSLAVSVSAEMLLQPASATCPALHSGSYRAIVPNPSGVMNSQFGTFTIDAVNGTLVNSAGQTRTLTPNGACRFTTDVGADVLVSQAGVVVMRTVYASGSGYGFAIAFPQQTHVPAELAGTWNAISLEANQAGDGYVGTIGHATFSAGGVLSDETRCANDTSWSVTGADCQAVSSSGLPPIAGNSDGGLDVTDAAGNVSRAFAYHAGGGGWLVVHVDSGANLSFWTPQRTLPLPTLGGVTSSWTAYAKSPWASPIAIDGNRNQTDTVDAASGSWTRTNQSIGSAVTWQETLTENVPQGYMTRSGSTVTASDGSTRTVRPFTGLMIQGLGITPLILPDLEWLAVSVTQ